MKSVVKCHPKEETICKLILFLLIFIHPLILNAQVSGLNDKYIKEEIYRSVIRNFIHYEVYKNIENQKKVFFSGDTRKLNFQNFIPDSNMYYGLFLKELNDKITLYNEEYTLIEVRGLTQLRIKMERDSIDKKLGLHPYDLTVNRLTEWNSSLIAYNFKKREILYLSGPFFLDSIINEYVSLSVPIDTVKVRQYVSLKYYMCEPQNIYIKAQRKETVIVEFQSGFSGETIQVTVLKRRNSIEEKIQKIFFFKDKIWSIEQERGESLSGITSQLEIDRINELYNYILSKVKQNANVEISSKEGKKLIKEIEKAKKKFNSKY